MSYLFHVEVNMPTSLAKPVFEGRLRYSDHARAEASGDRYGHIELPEFFEAQGSKLIEVEVDYDGERPRIRKQLWRRPLDDKRDIVMAVCPNGFVRTVWVNLRSDKHRTLDRSKYVGG